MTPSSSSRAPFNTRRGSAHRESTGRCWLAAVTDPALRGASHGVPVQAVLGEDACLEERLDQTQDVLVGDSATDPVNQRGVVDLVEAGGDVGLEHPPVVTGG